MADAKRYPSQKYHQSDALCACGCGGKTNFARQTMPSYGVRKGEPLYFRRGHQHTWRSKVKALGLDPKDLQPLHPEGKTGGYPSFTFLTDTPVGWEPPDQDEFPEFDQFLAFVKDNRNAQARIAVQEAEKSRQEAENLLKSKKKKKKKAPDPKVLAGKRAENASQRTRTPGSAPKIELRENEVLGWAPHSGPQTDYFKAKEFEVFYGGSAGGGKTDATIYLPLKWRDNGNFRAVVLRKTFPELQEIIDRSAKAYRHFGAQWHETKKRWTFPSGAVVEMGYFELWKHSVRYQGQEYNLINWDELGTVPEERFWTFMMSRCRSADPTLPKYLRATGNPGGAGHSWLMDRFITPCGEQGGTYTDEATGLMRRFIPARLSDNPSLEHADPGYRARLEALPDVLRRQLLEGDWGAASGLALHELNRDAHFCEPHPLEGPWTFWLAMDWGYQHPCVVGLFAAHMDGRVRLVESGVLWRKLPFEIAERVDQMLIDVEDRLLAGHEIRVQKFVAGRDCWSDHRARGEITPSVADVMAQYGHALTTASQARVAGLNNLRLYVTRIGPAGVTITPKFQFFDTPTNRKVFQSMQQMVLDPRDPADVLKVDADEYGYGGDDPYDMVRYGLAAKPLVKMGRKKKHTPSPNHDTEFERVIKKRRDLQRSLKRRKAAPSMDDWLRSGRIW